MIKVIEEKKEFQVTCENCGKLLSFEQEDIHYGFQGCAMITCPNCKKDTDTYLESLLINENNVEFPLHFYHFGELEGAVDIDEKKITEWVRQVLKVLRNSKEEYNFAEAGSGNTHIIGLKYMDGEIIIKVMKNYWDLSISEFEEEK